MRNEEINVKHDDTRPEIKIEIVFLRHAEAATVPAIVGPTGSSSQSIFSLYTLSCVIISREEGRGR